MKAAVCRSFREPLAIEDVTIRAPGENEVLVRVAACAVCHSDVSYIDGDWGGILPAVYGHEAAGFVEEVGPGAAGLGGRRSRRRHARALLWSLREVPPRTADLVRRASRRRTGRADERRRRADPPGDADRCVR